MTDWTDPAQRESAIAAEWARASDECTRLRSINADLLEALRHMVEVFDGPGGTDSPACTAARVAIAKAEGTL